MRNALSRLPLGFLFAVLAICAFGAVQTQAFETGQKTVHVKEYRRKDGTIVKAHDRKAPGTKDTASSSTKPSGKASPVVAETPAPVLTPATKPVALKLRAPLANHVDGIVTAQLASGAYIRLRAQDIDYERTAAYANRVIIKPETSTPMTAPDSGRTYFNLTFSNRFVATTWEDDIDFDEMRADFSTYRMRNGSAGWIGIAAYNQLSEGMTADQVTQILGVEPVEVSRADIGGAQTVLLQWKSASSVVVGVFKDGRLFSKLPFGLR